MNIHNVSLMVSAVKPNQYPEVILPEFAFVGRSNVGKSSLINKLLNRNSLARVSSKPGKTATVNFYNIDGCIYLVDLPGYGYAARSKEEIKKWGDIVEGYLTTRRISQIFMLVDSRHKPTTDDMLMLEWIRNYADCAVVVATKTDKLSKRQLEENLELIYNSLSLTEDDVLVPFNTKNDEGKKTVWDIIACILESES